MHLLEQDQHPGVRRIVMKSAFLTGVLLAVSLSLVVLANPVAANRVANYEGACGYNVNWELACKQ
jgi:hypothetical protein